MVGFSLGYLVVISTHLDEIGREQFCARFHKDSLRDLAYDPIKHKVATAGEHHIKIVDMKDWQELASEEISDGKGHTISGTIDKIHWTKDGNYLTVSARNGGLYVYAVDTDTHPLIGHSGRRSRSTSGAGSNSKGHDSTHSDTLSHQLLHQPIHWATVPSAAIGFIITLAIVIAIYTGIPLHQVWKLVRFTWSV